MTLAVESVSFAYPGRPPCLEEISFTVTGGQRVALLGANGSGKSTLLHLLDGLYFPMSGRVVVEGVTLTEEAVEQPPFGPWFRSQVGFVFQNSEAQLFCDTVEEELAFGPLQIGLPPAEARARVNETLELLEIPHLRDRAPQTLSGGEKKRVALGTALVTAPSVLLLDEPLTGLDPRSQSLLLELLDALAERGVCQIVTTHDLALAPYLAERAIVLGENHRLLADGPLESVLSDLALLETANLVHTFRHRHQDEQHRHPHPLVLGHHH